MAKKTALAAAPSPDDPDDPTATLADGKAKKVGTIFIARPQIGFIEVPIVGIAPLVIHAWSQKALQKMLAAQQQEPGTKAKQSREKRDPVADYNAARYVFADSNQEWDGIVAVAFKGSLVGACRQVSGLAMTEARRALFVRHDGVTHYHSPHSCRTEIGLVRIVGEPQMREDTARNSDGGTDLRFRPQYWPWSAVLRIEFNAAKFKPEAIVGLVANAGYYEGVGEWRPGSKDSNTGQLGRWEVDESKIIEGRMA